MDRKCLWTERGQEQKSKRIMQISLERVNRSESPSSLRTRKAIRGTNGPKFCGFSLSARGLLILTLTAHYARGQVCPPLGPPLYGELPRPCGTLLGERCHFGCERGFELIGSCHRECCSNGKWTGFPATCINRGVQCPPLSPPANGRFVNQCLSAAGWTCAFECNPGFALTGSPAIACLVTGVWSNPSPTCVRGSSSTSTTISPPPGGLCDDINPPRNGALRGKCVNATIDQVCRFDCDPGFSLIGVPQITCSSRGWSMVAPTCQAVVCPGLTAPANGQVSGQCSPGSGGQSCTFTCNSGYGVRGKGALTCLQTGQWDDPSPTCEPVTCNDLPTTLENGQVQGSCAPGLALQICNYACNSGYAMIGGSSTLVCQPNGMWTGSPPSCIRTICRSIISPPNDPLQVTGQCEPGYAGTSCNFRCAPGFFLIGSPTSTCLNNGQWTDQTPTCTQASCPALRRPIYGQLEGSCAPGYASSACNVTCSSGFTTIEGQTSTNMTCTATGDWDRAVPECLRVTCRPLPSPQNGIASDTCLSGLANQQCIFTCNENYALSPDTAINTCKPDGTWSLEPSPVCTQIECYNETITVDIPFGGKSGPCLPGRAGENCIYNCAPGFALVGNPSILCQVDGQWQGTAPACVRILCPVLNPPQNGAFIGPCATLVGAVCNVICSEGYDPVGGTRFQCQSNGLWSPQTRPLCEAQPLTQCPALSDPDYGTATGSCNPGIAGETCQFLCSKGFGLIGNEVMTCSQTGAWDERPPVCRPINCAGLQSPSNGYVFGQCSIGDPGMTCTFKCNSGFVLKGVRVVTCQQDGSWSTDPPFCGRGTCSSLQPPQPGGALQGTCQPGRSGEMCAFLCPQGYRISGLTNLICRDDGTWNGVVPRCLPWATRGGREDKSTGAVYCPGIYAPSGGSVSGTCYPGQPGRACTITCPQGYRLIGARSVQCLASGKWSPATPYCQMGGTSNTGPKCPKGKKIHSRLRVPRSSGSRGGSFQLTSNCRQVTP